MADFTHVLVLVIPQGAYGRGILQGVREVAAVREWLVSYTTTDDLEYKVRRNWPSAGVIVDTQVYEATQPELWQGRNIVGLQRGSGESEIPIAGVDDHAVGVEAARHLLGKGLQQFAIWEQTSMPWSQRRADGFRETVHVAGCSCQDLIVPFNDGTTPEWDDAHNMRGALRALPRGCGLFACCDGWGQVIVEWSRRTGLRVPEDIAIIGADNDDITCDLAMTPLSSVELPWRRVGFEAATIMDRLLRNDPMPAGPILAPPTGVVTRRSTDTLAVGDEDVAAALSFIRSSASEPITSADILKAVPAGRNRLQSKFKQLVGHTMMEEIRRVHIERAKHLLATTDLPMTELAWHCGYSDQSQFSVAFKRETGISPLQYRKRVRLPS